MKNVEKATEEQLELKRSALEYRLIKGCKTQK